MYGGSSKLSGRRGLGNAVGPIKRNIHSTFQPSSVQRPSSAAGSGGRGGHRNRGNTPATAPSVTVSSTAKRRKTVDSSNRFGSQRNTTRWDVCRDVDPAMEALFRDDPIRRPLGRNGSRRLSSSSDATSGRSTGSEASQRVSNFVQQQSEALARFEISHAMNILSKPIPDGLSRKDYKAQVAYRKHLQEQFGNQFYADGGDSDEDE